MLCFFARYCGFSGLILGKIAFSSASLSLANSRLIELINFIETKNFVVCFFICCLAKVASQVLVKTDYVF